MTQSTLHVAIIMDGNGRWADRRGLPRFAGHRSGERALRGVTKAASRQGIGTLTVYAFSADNWKRPPAEVRALMFLLETHLAKEMDVCRENGVRLSVIGRRDRIPEGARLAIEEAERITRGGSQLHLRLAVDYSSRDALVEASKCLANDGDRSRFAAELDSPDVDLLIRTGGEKRLSDFLLWECAYAELYFTPVLWPDFNEDDLTEALADYSKRQRRFGGLIEKADPRLAAGV